MLNSAGIYDVSFTQTVPAGDAASGDVALPYVMPEAEYMYGCVATSVGMLLGYYDLYGYVTSDGTYRFNNLIPGTISIDSRGSDGGSIYDMKDPSVLANFIASTEYVKRFYETTPASELPYTFKNSSVAQGLNTSVWNCLADYLGTGQYYRGAGDLSTQYYYKDLAWCKSSSQTYTVDTLAVPVKYIDFKYGLSLYVESVGYKLDETATRTVKIDEFSFDDYMAEIDAGRPVLLSLRSDKGGGHMVVGYGYNAGTREIIFDDTYRADCRMKWSGSYEYSSHTDFKLNAATTVVFDVSAMTPDSTIPPGTISGATVSTFGTVSGTSGYLAPAIVSGGTLNVVSGGTVDSGTVNSGGWMNVMTAGTASRTAVESGGKMWVADGGTAVSTGVAGSLFLGGEASETTVSSGGVMVVSSGGSTAATVVKNGGVLQLSSGGIFSGGTVSSGGSAVVSGGTLSGTLELYGTMRAASAVNASGASVRLHLENQTAPGSYFITAGSGKGLAGLAGADFTIVVGDKPSFGSFRIAEGAASFTGSMTLRSSSENAPGALTVDGPALLVGTAGYQLVRSAGALTLTVADCSVPPAAPTVKASTTAVTNKNVTLTATFGSDTETKQYSTDNKTWKSYTGAITVSANTTRYFRGLNIAGVASEVTSYKVGNIDKVAPAVPTVKASTTAPTRDNVVLTAAYSSDSVTKQYSLNNSAWIAYTGPVTVRLNNSVCRFRAVDAAGNSSVSSYTVKNIDRTPPAAPTVKASSTARSENPVTLSAAYSTDSVTKQFSLDGRNWLSYLGPVTVATNGTRYFRSIDAAGNVSAVTSYAVSNIIVAPAPANLVSLVKKYNVTYSWSKVAAEKGVKVKYRIKFDGVEQPKMASSPKYTWKNASVGSHTLAVQTVFLYRDGSEEHSNWRSASAKVADVTIPKLGKLSASVSGYTGTILLDASDNVGVTRYEVTLNGDTRNVTDSSAKFTNLAIGKHTASVQAFDAVGNASKIKKVKLTVKDVTAPGKVSKFNAVSVVKGKATLSWNAVNDNSGLPVSYELELGGKIIKAKTTSCSVKLAAGSYTYRVRAVDKAKNIGAWSSAQKFSIGPAVQSAALALSYCDALRLDAALQAAADASSLTASAVKEQPYLAAL